jgi:hypothetical protein
VCCEWLDEVGKSLSCQGNASLGSKDGSGMDGDPWGLFSFGPLSCLVGSDGHLTSSRLVCGVHWIGVRDMSDLMNPTPHFSMDF